MTAPDHYEQDNTDSSSPQETLSLIPATVLPREVIAIAIKAAAAEAIETGRFVMVLGLEDTGEPLPRTEEACASNPEFLERYQLCLGGCCMLSPGAITVIPDLLVMELTSHGYELPKGAHVAERIDGRSVAYFPGPVPADASPELARRIAEHLRDGVLRLMGAQEGEQT